MQNVALSWLVYRLTGSVFLLGIVGFTSQIPTFVLSPFTGVLTDKYNRRKIMLMAQTAFMFQSLILAVLVLLNIIAVWHIIALSLLFGFISAFDTPARQSLVIDLIDDPKYLGNAIALNSAIFNGARLFGPAIAGITIALVGEGICFLLNCISYISVIYALWRVNIKARQIKMKSGNIRQGFSEGIRYTFQSVPIRTLIIALFILSLVGLPFTVLLPAFAKEILNGSSDTLGFLMSAMGAGALMAAIYMAGRSSALGLGKIISRFLVLMGITLIAVSFANTLQLSVCILFFTGLAMIMSVAAINTMLQTLVNEDMRGRVMSYYSMALMGTMPIGNLLAGSVASAFGIPFTLILGGSITIIGGIWFGIKRKTLRRYIQPIYAGKGILPSVPANLS